MFNNSYRILSSKLSDNKNKTILLFLTSIKLIKTNPAENEEKLLTDDDDNEIDSKLHFVPNFQQLLDLLKDYSIEYDDENIVSDEDLKIAKRFRYRKNRKNRQNRGEVYRYGRGLA